MTSVKRVYEKPSNEDGYRILVDRLWPRGLSKEKSRIDLWIKEIAPSNELRKWYSHDPGKWEEFQNKYKAELNNKSELVNEVKHLVKKNKKITFLFSSKEEKLNNAFVLKKILEK